MRIGHRCGLIRSDSRQLLETASDRQPARPSPASHTRHSEPFAPRALWSRSGGSVRLCSDQRKPGGAGGTRTHDPGIMRATAITTEADFRLQESVDHPLQLTLPPLFDTISHHDRHHGPASGMPQASSPLEEGARACIPGGRPPKCLSGHLLRCPEDVSSFAWGPVVFGDPGGRPAQTRPDDLGDTRCAVRLSPDSRSGPGVGGDGAVDEDTRSPVSLTVHRDPQIRSFRRLCRSARARAPTRDVAPQGQGGVATRPERCKRSRARRSQNVPVVSGTCQPF
jgi:hypothetical protein